MLIATTMLGAMLTAGAAAGAATDAPAADPIAETLTRCASPRVQVAGDSAVPGAVLLVRSGDRLQVQFQYRAGLRWQVVDRHAEVITAAAQQFLYHLAVPQEHGIEHFLFTLSPDHSGRLLWSGEAGSAVIDCAPPQA